MQTPLSPVLQHVRFGVVLFVQFFAMGAVIPVLTHYLLQDLRFSAEQAGVISSTSAVSALVTPLVGMLLADHRVSSHLLYSSCSLLSAVCSFMLARQSAFGGFIAWYSLFCLVFGPMMTLAASIVLHSLSPAERERFAGFRIWATVGWLAAAWGFGYFWLRSGGTGSPRTLRDGFVLSGWCFIFLGIYSLTLPSSRIRSPRRPPLVPKEALPVLRNPTVGFLLLIAFCASFMDRFYYFGAAPYLQVLGIENSHIMPLMSLGQVVEVFAMAGTAWMVRRFGFRITIFFGLCAHLIRFSLLAWTHHPLFVALALACHGFAFAWCYTAVQVFLDHFCSAHSRSAVQFVLSLITSGAAAVVASNAAGALMGAGGRESFVCFWAVPAAAAALMLAALPLLRENAAGVCAAEDTVLKEAPSVDHV